MHERVTFGVEKGVLFRCVFSLVVSLYYVLYIMYVVQVPLMGHAMYNVIQVLRRCKCVLYVRERVNKS